MILAIIEDLNFKGWRVSMSQITDRTWLCIAFHSEGRHREHCEAESLQEALQALQLNVDVPRTADGKRVEQEVMYDKSPGGVARLRVARMLAESGL